MPAQTVTVERVDLTTIAEIEETMHRTNTLETGLARSFIAVKAITSHEIDRADTLGRRRVRAGRLAVPGE